jgi:DNA-binding CsgD family transcriptional regulator
VAASAKLGKAGLNELHARWHGNVKVLLITERDDADWGDVLGHPALGGVVSGATDAAVLVQGVMAVMRGMPDPGASDRSGAAESGGLSFRESQVLKRIADGRTQGQIARDLGISPHTVDTYVRRIRTKLRLGSKAELVKAALLGDHDGRDLAGTAPGSSRAS